MSQISSIFKSQKKALIPYITFGDPNPEFSLNLARALFDAGADIIEIGIPFSDPIADGPVIQASHSRALQQPSEVSIQAALHAVSVLKKEYPHKAIAFMLATNLVMHYGVEAFMRDSAKQGLDAVVIPDLSFEMSENYVRLAEKSGIDLVQLISPLCDEERLVSIAKASRGFLYLISSTGITGERQAFSQSLKQLCDTIRSVSDIPIAIGFGISSEEHVKEMSQFADALIVGSHLVSLIESHLDQPNKALAAMSDRVALFKSCLQ